MKIVKVLSTNKTIMEDIETITLLKNYYTHLLKIDFKERPYQELTRVIVAIRQHDHLWGLDNQDTNDKCHICGRYAAGIGFSDRYWQVEQPTTKLINMRNKNVVLQFDDNDDELVYLCDPCFDLPVIQKENQISQSPVIRMND